MGRQSWSRWCLKRLPHQQQCHVLSLTLQADAPFPHVLLPLCCIFLLTTYFSTQLYNNMKRKRDFNNNNNNNNAWWNLLNTRWRNKGKKISPIIAERKLTVSSCSLERTVTDSALLYKAAQRQHERPTSPLHFKQRSLLPLNEAERFLFELFWRLPVASPDARRGRCVRYNYTAFSALANAPRRTR